MAIQQRRGAYADFDPQKMIAGEPAVVLSGDPNATDGKAAYIAFGSGNVKRLVTSDELDSINEEIEDIAEAINALTDIVTGD